MEEGVEASGERGQAPTRVDQDRHVARRRQLEHRREAVVVEQELLRPRMQLDPARPEVEAAGRFVDRPLAEVEADGGIRGKGPAMNYDAKVGLRRMTA